MDLRAVGRSENPGVPVLFGGHNLSPLVEIGLTDLTKSWGAEKSIFTFCFLKTFGPTEKKFERNTILTYQ